MTEATLNCAEAQTGHPIHTLSNRLFDRLRNIQRRRKLTRLLDLDDHILNDIGVTRGDLDVALDMPLSVNAATELHRMSLERRRRKM